MILEHYSNKNIEKYFSVFDLLNSEATGELKGEERVILQMLNDMKSIVIAA